jgi:hypothetical protein
LTSSRNDSCKNLPEAVIINVANLHIWSRRNFRIYAYHASAAVG